MCFLLFPALDLNMYRFLAPDTFNQLSEYVPVIGTTALSTVYDVRASLAITFFTICFIYY